MLIGISWFMGGKYYEGCGFASDCEFISHAIRLRSMRFTDHKWPKVYMRISAYGGTMHSNIMHSQVGSARHWPSEDSISIRVDISEDLMLEPDMVRRLRMSSLLVTAAEKATKRAKQLYHDDIKYPVLDIVTDACLEYMALPSPLPNMFKMREMLGRPISQSQG